MWVNEFTRSDLKSAESQGGKYKELEVSWVNPRTLHRKLISELEDEGFLIISEKDESIEIKKDEVGTGTGTVTSRINAKKQFVEYTEIETPTFEKWLKPLKALLGFLVVIGLIGILDTNLNADIIVGGGVSVIILGAGYFYMKKKTTMSTISFTINNTIRILTKGEVTERKKTEGKEEVSELQSQVTISVGSISNIVCNELVDEDNQMNSLNNSDNLENIKEKYKEIKESYKTAIADSLRNRILQIEPRAGEVHTVGQSGFLSLFDKTIKDNILQQAEATEVMTKAILEKISKDAKEVTRPYDKTNVSKSDNRLSQRDGQFDIQVKKRIKNGFEGMDPEEFEIFMKRIFQGMGYNVELTAHRMDYGADLILSSGEIRQLVELKCYSMRNKVGNQEIRKTIGALQKHGCQKAIFITTSSFTEAAYEQSKESPILLIDNQALMKILNDYLVGHNVSW